MLGTRLVSALLAFVLVSSAAMANFAPVVAQSGYTPFVPAGLVEIERGSRTLDEIAAGFPSPDEAASLLAAWEWQGNAYFNFAGSTANGIESLEISYHLFGSPDGATEAMSYYAASRALMLGFSPVPIGRIGDDVLAVGGLVDGGNEVTLYVRYEAFLVRISAVAPFGDPLPDAAAAAEGVVLQFVVDGRLASERTYDSLLPSPLEMPAYFVVSDEGTRDIADIADTFARPREAGLLLDEWGFDGNVYRYFAVPSDVGPYPGAATSIEISLHLFDDRAMAEEALVYYAVERSDQLGLRMIGEPVAFGDGAFVLQGAAPSGNGIEVTVYMLIENVLARISAVSPDGAPIADALSTAWVVAARSL